MKFFDQKVKISGPKKSKFDLSHEKKLSFNMGELVPILVQDVMPGDSFRVASEQMLRLAPMLAPMMHRVNVYMHFFFVPNRLVWTEWEKFITGGDGDKQPAFPAPPVFPTVTVGQWTGGIAFNWFDVGSLADYMGVPTQQFAADTTSPIKVSALPFRAYQLIWDEYYRDQDIQDKLIQLDPVFFGSGPVPGNNYAQLLTLRKRAWEKDYFTSARPFAQKSGAVGIPFEYKPISEVLESDGSLPVQGFLTANPSSQLQSGSGDGIGTGGTLSRVENIERLATINEFREANALQRFLEKLARAGNRYIEYIKVIFGETSSDSRLQRPEYLGGGRAPIVISEVLSTFDNTAGGNPQGTMSGHGISVGNSNGFTQSFNEHGYIIGLMSVLPRTGYQQGIAKHFTRFDQFDFPIPDFAHLGEQEVKQKELYVDINTAVTENEKTFGYQSRYSECKFQNSTSHGDFRTTLAFWHMDRIFATSPDLNASFIESDPTLRIFAITDPDLDHLWCVVYNHVSAIRPLPYYGTPTL